ncbi:hypothetical protein EV714DRAFT_240545, partial [Schizophyllum commune]
HKVVPAPRMWRIRLPRTPRLLVAGGVCWLSVEGPLDFGEISRYTGSQKAYALSYNGDFGWKTKFNVEFVRFLSDIAGCHRDGNSEHVPDPFLSCTQLPLMVTTNRVAQASSAQGVEYGMSYAGRTSSHDAIPPSAHDVAARFDLKRDTQGDNAAFAPAGRKIHAVVRPENSLPHPLGLTTTRQTPPRVQSPIDRLPNELLCAIFLLTGDPSPVSGFPRDPDMHDDGINPFAVRLYSKAAVTIGRVCSRWMGLTRGFPALWTLVDVAFPAAESTTILKRCLEYSAGLPLVLWISRSVDVGACDRKIDPRFMRLVATNAHRWIEISIEMFNEHDALQPLIALPAGSFSALRRARLTFWGRGSTDRSADTLLWNVFHTSPQLVSLDWNHAEHIQSGLALAPLHQLTELGLHFAQPDTLVPILRSCTSLEVLLIGIHPTWKIMGNEGPISLQLSAHLPRLRVLTCRGPYDWAQLFSLLYVPALVRLDLGHMDVNVVDIEMVLRRSSARLMMLTIYRPAINQADNIIALLRSSILQGLSRAK